MNIVSGWELSFALSSFGTGLISLILAVAVFLGNPYRVENRAWALASICVAIWAGGLGFAIISSDKALSYGWNQVFYFGGVWIPTTFFGFVSVFTKKNHGRILLIISVIFSLILSLIIVFKPTWFIQNLVPKGGFKFWEILGPAYHVFSVFFFTIMTLAIFWFYCCFQSAPIVNQKKMFWIFIGMAIGIFGGATNFFYDYGINIPPFGQFLVFLYPLLVSWAVVRHQALDIGILFRKTGLLLSIYFFLVILVVPVLILFHSQIGVQNFRGSILFSLAALISGFILSTGPFVYAYAIRESSYFRENEMAGITHELKTPLGNILSAMDFLRDLKKGPQLSERHENYLQMIDRNAERLGLAINNLLTIFQLPTNIEPLIFNNLNLDDLINELFHLYADLAQENNIELIYQNPLGVELIRGDKEKLHKVFSNLLSNAIKFTKDGSVTLKVEKSIDKVDISVTDTGAGISPEELPRVFDRFFQGQRNKNTKGSGVGLTIAKMWVEAHGGRIGVESEGVGKGARFWVELPVN